MQSKPLILVIDDLKSNRMVIKKTLQNDYDFIEAANGEEALTLLNSFEPMIILIDAIMPKLDGFDTITKIREIKKFKRTPILMITSLGDSKSKVKALKYGVNDFLTKPFDKYELKARCYSYVKMMILDHDYSEIRINPISKFFNEIAFIKDLKPNDAIFLFSINDFNATDTLYGYKKTKIIEQKIGVFIKNMTQEYLNNITLYHIGSGKFIVKLNEKKDFNENQLEELCEEFYNNCKNYNIEFDEVFYTPVVTIIFAKNRANLYEDALSALSYAKKNNFHYLYSETDLNYINDIIYSNIEILKKVKKAISNNKIINYYQPIFDNKKGKVTKYETLVRLETEKKEILSPYQFLTISKSAQIYNDITKIVYQNAFNKFKFNNYNFSMNISFLDIQNKIVRNFIYEILYNNPHVSNRIIFEILEDESIKEIKLVQEFVKEVRKYGAKIAIDDFGSGFSNFQRIIDLEPNFLKIDGSIVKNITNNLQSYTLLESIIQFSHNFNIKTIAEFVSNKEIFEELQSMEIDYLQGYYIGEPSPYLLDEKAVIETC